MRRIATAVVAALAALALFTSTGDAHAVTFGSIFNENPLYGIDDPSNAGLSGDILTYDKSSLQGAQWSWDQSTYNAGGTGPWYEIVLKNDANGKMCIDDKGGVSGGRIAIKDCNSSASQAWYVPCYVLNTDPVVPEPTLIDARGKGIRLAMSGGAPEPVLAITPIEGDGSYIWWGPPGIPHYDPQEC